MERVVEHSERDARRIRQWRNRVRGKPGAKVARRAGRLDCPLVELARLARDPGGALSYQEVKVAPALGIHET
jgi:hypothetical protein